MFLKNVTIWNQACYVTSFRWSHIWYAKCFWLHNLLYVKLNVSRNLNNISRSLNNISCNLNNISHNLNNIKISCNLNNTSRKRMRDETTKTTPATRAAVLILLSKYTANKFLLTQHLLKRDKLCDLDRYFIIQQLTALKVKHLRWASCYKLE